MFSFLKFQNKRKKNFLKLLSFRSNLTLFFIFNISFFIFDFSKAERNYSNSDETINLEKDYSDSKSQLAEFNFDSKNINQFDNYQVTNMTEIDIDYLDPKNALKDYIIDTGDSLLIEFKNKPRGLEFTDSNFDPQKTSYLKPKKDLKNYKLDSGDTLLIKFNKTPELNIEETIDSEGEIYLSRLRSIYVKGLTIYQLKELLEKSYDEFLIDPEIEIRISRFRFISSGTYRINNEGEIMLPILNETYVRGLTTNELSNLLRKKYLEAESISSEIDIRVARFKPQRIFIYGEVRNPGVYKFSSYSSGEFLSVENFDNNSSPNEEMENFDNDPSIKIIGQQSLSQEKINRNGPRKNLGEISQNNDSSAVFQIKRPSGNYTTISNAIRRAGGITSKTDLSRIEIIRDIPIGQGGGKKRAIIDFTSFLNESNPVNDIRLFDGDRIFLPKMITASSDILPKSILTGLSPKFITVDIFGRIENPGTVKLPLEATLSDAIDLTGPIKPLSGKIILIRYKSNGTILKKNISYSSRARRGSRRNPYVKQGDLITVTNSLLGKTSGVIKEITTPFIGIYSTKEVIEGFSD